MPIKTQQDEQPTLNLTPMIDVVFLLIIFFMVATRFSERERDIEINLPEVATAQALTSAPKQRVVSVHDDGQVVLDREEVTLEELTQQLAAAQREYPNLSVVIRCDAACTYQYFVGALAACKEANITDLGITTKIAEGKRGKLR